ncbi:acetyltransferase [Lophiotrema nucula]|uniref:Acetyltransferase n=1 Tax=Lophiotrema nucula TaxID=690887 RepID=A0A6A5ZG30_9PLEO|nr:acetyltransferase [Lophiotrema nucula]
MEPKEWRRNVGDQSYLISTERELLDETFIQAAFGTKDMSWAKPTSKEKMKTLLDNSCTLGLYQVPLELAPHQPSIMVGIARIITDYVTFAYLTDVYVLDEYRKLGLGKWLIACLKEIFLMIPDLRRAMLLTGSENAQRMYERDFGMEIMSRDDSGLVAMGVTKAVLESLDAKVARNPAT